MSDDLVKRLRDEHLAMTRTEAADRIEQLERDLKTVLDREAATYARHDAKSEKLEREKREAALDALAAMGQAQEAYEAQLKAEAKVEKLEQEHVLDAKLLADTQALLDKAVVALREASSFLWHMTNAIDDEDYKGPHDGFNVPLVCHVQPYHDLHVEQLKTQAEKVDATLAEIEGKKDE
jgi:hypothetical protein